MEAMTVALHPGPEDPSVLYLQNEHRSKHIWETGDETTLYCRHGGIHLFKDRPDLDTRILDCLRMAGFYGAYRLGYFEIDHSLVTAFVERWRVETHSFHLPVGEATITLQDMGVLTGLRVDGGAITGRDLSLAECVDLCNRLLGSSPPEGKPNWVGNQISLQWLSERFVALPPDATDEVVRFHARAVIMYMLGSYLLPNKKGTHVPVLPLQLLENLEDCGKLAWGAGVLAYLYRELCRATPTSVREIAGCLHVIQLWAWERLSCIRPHIIDGVQLRGQSEPEDPRGRRWACHSVNAIQHSLRHYRDQLDRLTYNEMKWEPYSAETLSLLPTFCTEGNTVWRARVPLIYFDIVEHHLPDRVLRQFGLQQPIPVICHTSQELHKTDRRGRSQYDWSVLHSNHIAQWNDRHTNVVSGAPISSPMEATDEYMVWFRKRTRLLIQPPDPQTRVGFIPAGAQQELLVQALSMVLRIASSHTTVDEVHVHQSSWKRVVEICTDTAVQTVGIGRLLADPPSAPSRDVSTSEGYGASHRGIVLHRPRRGGRGRGRGCGRAPGLRDEDVGIELDMVDVGIDAVSPTPAMQQNTTSASTSVPLSVPPTTHATEIEERINPGPNAVTDGAHTVEDLSQVSQVTHVDRVTSPRCSPSSHATEIEGYNVERINPDPNVEIDGAHNAEDLSQVTQVSNKESVALEVGGGDASFTVQNTDIVYERGKKRASRPEDVPPTRGKRGSKPRRCYL